MVGALPVSKTRRTLAVAVYVPIIALVLPIYGLLFAGYVFGDWL